MTTSTSTITSTTTMTTFTSTSTSTTTMTTSTSTSTSTTTMTTSTSAITTMSSSSTTSKTTTTTSRASTAIVESSDTTISSQTTSTTERSDLFNETSATIDFYTINTTDVDSQHTTKRQAASKGPLVTRIVLGTLGGIVFVVLIVFIYLKRNTVHGWLPENLSWPKRPRLPNLSWLPERLPLFRKSQPPSKNKVVYLVLDEPDGSVQLFHVRERASSV